MAKSIAFRLQEEELERLEAEAARRDVSAGQLAAELTVAGLNAPPVPKGLDTLLLSESQVASLDQTAQRWGLSRVDALQRIVKERILKEYVDERNRQAFSKKVVA